MNFFDRAWRHLRISYRNKRRLSGPSFLILFINSACNQKCEHCFYWRNLNRKDDLSQEELFALSNSIGRVETLNLSGGEPFLRPDFSDVCRQFARNNKVRQIYVPTNAYFTELVLKQTEETLRERELEYFVIEMSLEGQGEFHDRFRGSPGAFEKAIHTYDALARLQNCDPRLRIHSVSTATANNLEEIAKLTVYLHERCPQMDHHNLAMIRGDRKNALLQGPSIAQYNRLYAFIRQLWSTREVGRYGSIVEPMLQWAKTRTVNEQRQVIPCRAGALNAVVYANGDVSLCESLPPLGNLRQNSFPSIWNSSEAQAVRKSIRTKECYCTNEIFLWPSIVFQPRQLLRAMLGARIWRRTPPLQIESPLPPVHSKKDGASSAPAE